MVKLPKAAASPLPTGPTPGKALWLGLLLTAGLFLAYGPALKGGFVWDDDVYVVDNELLTAPDGLRRIWFSYDAPSQYFPLTYTVLRAQRALWGLDTAGYHAVNILLHAGSAVLLWWLLAGLSIPGAMLAAALWALHPVQVESVAWITELKNVLSVFLYLLSLLTWLRSTEEPGPASWRRAGLALFIFFMALCAKTTACTLPAAMVIAIWAKGRTLSRRQWGQVAAFMAVGVAMGLFCVWWERHVQGTQGGAFRMSPLESLLVAGRAVWFYLGKLAWPSGLVFSYPRWAVDVRAPAQYLWPMAVLGLGALLWLRRRAWPAVGLAGLFFVAALSPLLGFIPLYTFQYTFVADHYQYIACAGPLALLAAAMARRLGEGAAKPFYPFICAGLLAAMAFQTWRQAASYKDIETLWRDTVRKSPASWMAHDSLGCALMDRRDFAGAISHFQEAMRLNPGHFRPHYNLAVARARLGEPALAEASYGSALRLNPDHMKSRYNLSRLLMAKGLSAQAAAQYEECVRRDPSFAPARLALGLLHMEQGRLEAAEAQFLEVLRRRPDNAEASNDLGMLRARQGRLEEAARAYERSIAARPDNPRAYNNLANLLLRLGRPEPALTEFDRSLALEPGFFEAHYNRALALEQLGRGPEAAAGFARALELRPGFPPALAARRRLLRRP